MNEEIKKCCNWLRIKYPNIYTEQFSKEKLENIKWCVRGAGRTSFMIGEAVYNAFERQKSTLIRMQNESQIKSGFILACELVSGLGNHYTSIKISRGNNKEIIFFNYISGKLSYIIFQRKDEDYSGLIDTTFDEIQEDYFL